MDQPLIEVAQEIIRQTLDEAKAFINTPASVKLSEADTKAYFIEPLLAALGWRGIGIVSREFRVKSSGEFIDYVMLEDGKPLLAIEAKPIQTSLTAKDSAQLVQYCVIEGIQWAALTNGRELQFFNTYLTPDLDAKRVLTLSLLGYDTDAEFIAVVQQLALLSRQSIILPQGAESWLRQRRMDDRLRSVLLDSSSATAKSMRKALDEAGIKTSPSEITTWVRSNLLKESTVITQPKPMPPSLVPAQEDDVFGNTVERKFDPLTSSVFKSHLHLLPILQEIMQLVAKLDPDSNWRDMRHYFAASNKAGETFLAIKRSGNVIIVGLSLPESAAHPRLDEETFDFRWNRITKTVSLSGAREVDDQLSNLISGAIENAGLFPSRSKRFFGSNMRDLLNAGLVQPGEKLFLMKGTFQVAQATFTPSAQIDWQGKLYSVPSDLDFARAMGNKSLNGWTSWYVERAGRLVQLFELREQLTNQ